MYGLNTKATFYLPFTPFVTIQTLILYKIHQLKQVS